jgi:hypothetical protein
MPHGKFLMCDSGVSGWLNSAVCVSQTQDPPTQIKGGAGGTDGAKIRRKIRTRREKRGEKRHSGEWSSRGRRELPVPHSAAGKHA